MAISNDEEKGAAQLFTHAGTTYSVGDWVALKNDSERDWVAKVVGFDPCDDTENNSEEGIGKIRCQWAWYPDDLKTEVLADLDTEAYSAYEVVPSVDFVDSNPVGSIKHKLQVLSYEEFRRLEHYPRTAPNQYPPPIIFYRQTFNSSTGLDPELPLDTVVKVEDCGKLCYGARNPDLVYYRCTQCDVVYHPKATGAATSTKKLKPNSPDTRFVCGKCEKASPTLPKVDAESGTVSAEKQHGSGKPAGLFHARHSAAGAAHQSRSTDLTGQMSATNERKSKKSRHAGGIVGKSGMPQKKMRTAKGDSTDDDTVSVNSSSSGDMSTLCGQHTAPQNRPKSGRSPPLESSQKPYARSLSTLGRSASISSVGSARKQFSDGAMGRRENSGDLSLNVRDLRRSKLLECLQRGASELQQNNQSHLMMKDTTPEALAELIEEQFFKMYGHHDARQQKQRFFDIYSNLKRDNNADLRRKVWTSEMTVSALVTADAQALAPDTLQREREAEQQKYFAEQVLLKGVAKPVLRLTHKGLEEIQPQRDEPDVTAVLSKSKKTVSPSSNRGRRKSSLSYSVSSSDSHRDDGSGSSSLSSGEESHSSSSSSDESEKSKGSSSDSSIASHKLTKKKSQRGKSREAQRKERNTKPGDPDSGEIGPQYRAASAEIVASALDDSDRPPEELKKETKSEITRRNESLLATLNEDNNVECEDGRLKKKKRILEMVPEAYKDILLAPPNIEKFKVEVLAGRLKERLLKLNNVAISNSFFPFLNKALSRVEKLQHFVSSQAHNLTITR